MLNVAFAGTPEFAVPTLHALLSAPDITVKCVLTQPDRPAGRGRQLSESAVKRCARDAGLTIWQPERLSTPDNVNTLQAMQLDVLVVVAYGQLLKPEILQIPKYGCLNVHASLLPRWRGAAPIQRAIEAGDTETGITIMQMDAGLDTGPMLATETVPIDPSMTAARLHDQLATCGGPLLVTTLRHLVSGQCIAVPQTDDANVTYAKKIQVEEALIHWDRPAAQVQRQIHAFNPFPGAYAFLGADRLKIFEVDVCETDNLNPGQWQQQTDGSIHIGTQTFDLDCRSLQLPGQKRIEKPQIQARRGAPWNRSHQLGSSPGGAL